ncbi:MAG: flagellar hook-associated protein FlgK [Rhizobiaceae bacterium]|nr:flagellar hook-associated protein FlgK [Rhizobiaceae bacterium]
MSLSTAFNIAQSSLFNNGRQTSILSRNIQEVGNTDYSRRLAVLASTLPGAQVVTIQRNTNEQIFRQNLSSLSSWAGQSALSDGLEQLETLVNGVNNAGSAATAIGKLQEALQAYSAAPSNGTLAANAVDAARQVVNALNTGTSAIQSVRTDADSQIGNAVTDLNNLLSQFKQANDTVIAGGRSGKDVSDALDQRDALLKKIAEYVPVNTLTRSDGDMVLTTKDGVTLFETVPRTVSFSPTASFGATTTGNPVYVDGVPVALASGGNTDASGKIAGLLQLRDGVATTMQGQLDEVARGLVSAFAETGTGVANAAGLFTWAGGPQVPADGTLVTGLAGSIRLNAAFDPSSGGNATLLRDGGANGAAYVKNTTGAAGYNTLLLSYGSRLDEPMTFDAAAGLTASRSVSDYSTASIGWFSALRQDASTALQNKEALSARLTEALSNATGVNVDTEMSLLLELENTYQATSRIIKAVDDMMATLFAAVS